MGWLSGWDKRIKLTVDHDDIDADVSYFPVTVFLSSTHGDCVFDELTSDANRTKIAFTKSDGTTQMYGEIEKWDDGNEVAIIHVSITGWSISSSADTDFYLYYDSTHAANTTYIGDIDSTPGHSVWDSNFKFVCHMADATTSTVKDSTSNGNDGTKGSANNPIEAVGKIGSAQDFDGGDYITVADSVSLDQTYITVEAIVSFDDIVASEQSIFSRDNVSDRCWQFRMERVPQKVGFIPFNTSGTPGIMYGDTGMSANTFYYVVGNWDGTNIRIYLDGSADGTPVAFSGTLQTSSAAAYIGRRSSDDYWFGVIDEVRYSGNARSAAWIAATYDSLWDTLLTYGSEEAEGWTGKVMGVTNPAKIMGVAVADIGKVMGVE